MSIRKALRKPDELGSLELFSELDEDSDSRLALNDSRRIDAVVSRFGQGLRTALDIPARVHGWRTQGMFPAVVLALGGIRLLTAEDAGSYYFDDAYGPAKAPDFRVITARGEHLLVEVRNVGPAYTLKKRTMSEAEFQGAQRYADWTGARLMIAHYWAGPNLWTLVDSRALTPFGGTMRLTLEEALPANEFGMLGDAWVGTTPPLVLSLVADPAQPRTVDDQPGASHASFVIGGLEISCRGRRLEADLERRIAWSLMAFGGWHAEENVEVDDDGKVVQLSYRFEPAEPVEAPQGFEIVGPLSSLYSALYNLMTLDEDGEVTSLRRSAKPGILRDLIPDDYWDDPDRALPLWRLNLHPREAAEAG